MPLHDSPFRLPVTRKQSCSGANASAHTDLDAFALRTPQRDSKSAASCRTDTSSRSEAAHCSLLPLVRSRGSGDAVEAPAFARDQQLPSPGPLRRASSWTHTEKALPTVSWTGVTTPRARMSNSAPCRFDLHREVRQDAVSMAAYERRLLDVLKEHASQSQCGSPPYFENWAFSAAETDVLPSDAPQRGTRMLALAAHCDHDLAAKRVWSLDDFVVERGIAESMHGVLLQGRFKHSLTKLALKVYTKAQLTYMTECRVRREIAIHCRLDHPNIIKLHGAFETDTHIVLVMQYAEKGDLFQHVLLSGGRPSERDVAAHIARPCLSALEYLHKQRIFHRNVKLEHVLIAADGTPKLCDFGLAIDTDVETPLQCVGTLACTSPEVLRCSIVCDRGHGGDDDDDDDADNCIAALQTAYCSKVDCWSLGCMVYDLLTSAAPFAAETAEATIQAIFCKPVVLPTHVTPACEDFVHRALARDAGERYNSSQLLSHRWIQPDAVRRKPRAARRLFDAFGTPHDDGASAWQTQRD